MNDNDCPCTRVPQTAPAEPPVQPWYFTFGCGHRNGPNGYVRIEGTYNQAREEMFRRYENKWAFQYDEAQFLPQIERFNLYEVEPDEDCAKLNDKDLDCLERGERVPCAACSAWAEWEKRSWRTAFQKGKKRQ